MVKRTAHLLALIALGVFPVCGQVVMNEILFVPDLTAADPLRTHQWVELYNAGSNTADLTGWIVSGNAGAQGNSARTLPAIQLPAGGYLVVHFTSGQNRLDFANGSGDYYTGDSPSVPVWTPWSDEAALYSTNGIVDFLAWATSAQVYTPGAAATDAVTGGIWTKGDYVQASYIGRPGEPVRRIAAGYSIGRDANSTDTNSSADFDAPGGVHALDITPGRQNFDPLDFVDVGAAQPQPQVRAARPRDGQQAQWTVLLYMAADSNITQPAYRSAVELGLALNKNPTSDVNYVLLFDGKLPGQPDPNNPGQNLPAQHQTMRARITGTTITQVMRPDGSIENHFQLSLQDITEKFNGSTHLDTGDPATLADFINWAQTNYPAQKYGLVFLTHGNGWKSLAPDEGAVGARNNTQNAKIDPKSLVDRLYMGELKEGLRHGANFDLIAFDSCLMGSIEVATQIAPYGSYMLASEEIVMANTFPYGQMVKSLATNSGQSGLELGNTLADAWAARDGNPVSLALDEFGSSSPPAELLRWSVALVDLSAIPTLEGDVDTWARQLTTATPLVQGRDDPTDNVQVLLSNAAQAATRFNDNNFMDLGHFATLVQKAPTIPACAKTEIPTLLNDLDVRTIVKLRKGPGFPDIHGLHIYFPQYRTLHAPASPQQLSTNVSATGTNDPYDAPDTRITDGSSPLAAYAPNSGFLPLKALDEEDGTELNAPVDWPRKATPNFRWVVDYKNHWSNFLERFYRPVVDNHIVSAKQPDGTVLTAIPLGGGACQNAVDFIGVKTGSTILLSGKGSSDADMPKGTDPLYYFWDEDYRLDCRQKNGQKCVAPTEVPDGSDAALNSNNNKDQDQYPEDTPWDDQDAAGVSLQYPCTAAQRNEITLMVWDDNHTFKLHDTNPHASYVHPQTDSGLAIVACDDGPTFTIIRPGDYYAFYAWALGFYVQNADGTPGANMTISAMPSAGVTVSGLGQTAAGTGQFRVAAPHAVAPLQITTDKTGFGAILVSSDSGSGSVTLAIPGGKPQVVSFNVQQPNDPAPTGVQVNAPGTLTLNQPARITANAQNQQGPVSEVTFLALTPNVQFTDNKPYGSGRGTQAFTDSSGASSVSVTATAGGIAQIAVMLGNTVKTLSIPIQGGTPPADTLQMTPSAPAVVTAAGVATSLTFTVLAGTQPVSGAKIVVQVTQTVPGAGSITLTPAPASGSQTTLTTDSKGTAALNFTGTTPGLATLTVSVSGTNLQRIIPVVLQ